MGRRTMSYDTPHSPIGIMSPRISLRVSSPDHPAQFNCLHYDCIHMALPTSDWCLLHNVPLPTMVTVDNLCQHIESDSRCYQTKSGVSDYCVLHTQQYCIEPGCGQVRHNKGCIHCILHHSNDTEGQPKDVLVHTVGLVLPCCDHCYLLQPPITPSVSSVSPVSSHTRKRKLRSSTTVTTKIPMVPRLVLTLKKNQFLCTKCNTVFSTKHKVYKDDSICINCHHDLIAENAITWYRKEQQRQGQQSSFFI
jgi:hypothetical protein